MVRWVVRSALMVRNLPSLFSVVEVLVQRAVQASASVLLSDVSLHCSPQLRRAQLRVPKTSAAGRRRRRTID